jgi:hypothetical protein
MQASMRANERAKESRSRGAVLTVLAIAIGCTAVGVEVGCSGGPRIVPLLGAAGMPVTPMPSSATPLEVVSRSTAVRDPLPVRGTDIVYGDLESALGIAVSSAVVPWADAHRAQASKHGGWSMLVEVITADAEMESGGRVVVTINVRATLRTRDGNQYLAQTQDGCREGGLRSADQGAPVMYRCMMHIGRDLAGWLGGVPLDPNEGGAQAAAVADGWSAPSH